MDMAGFFALRCEMRSIVLRGVRRLREIESFRESEESMRLESIMADATVAPDGISPSPREIRLACEAIRARWSDDEHEFRMHRIPGDAVLKTFTTEEREARYLKMMREAQRRLRERKEAAGGSRRKYREENREKIKANHRAYSERRRAKRLMQLAAAGC